MKLRSLPLLVALGSSVAPLVASPALPAPAPSSRIVLVGGGLGERIQHDGQFETQLHLRYPERNLIVRNLCQPGDTASYRPRASRGNPWAFPGAEKLRPELRHHRGDGVEPSMDEWITLCRPDIVIGLFGYNESFDGPAGLESFRKELDAWIRHTKATKYGCNTPPAVALVSPLHFEPDPSIPGFPDGKTENENLAAYSKVMGEVAEANDAGFVDLFAISRDAGRKLTANGFLPDEDGFRYLTPKLLDAMFGASPLVSKTDAEKLRSLVIDKGRQWRDDYRTPNGVHVHGRRRKPFGTVNYPKEIEKLRELATNRDNGIHALARGEAFDLAAADAKTVPLPAVETNFNRAVHYLTEDVTGKQVRAMDGFEIELFATEERFPDLRNPVQMTFDNRGRLWVSVMPSYPHPLPGTRPDDKILIFEDRDGDQKADHQIVFADGLCMPTGFEIQPDGVYVSEPHNLLKLVDTDGDDRADVRETVLSGFDPHDTHHMIGAFQTDPSGAIYLLEGVFLHSQVETAYGPRRDTGSGVWRYEPATRRLERFGRVDYANPWGLVFDDWGQGFLADASSGENWWQLPLSVNVPFGRRVEKTGTFVPKRARPTSGSAIVSSRHFPDDMQGGYLVNNVIGFLGTSLARMQDDGSGFRGEISGDLVTSKDPNFRPCDLEFAPDGSLYLLDWHNPLIGHMQHSARDPKRDHDHGRIYRITCKDRPLVKPVKIAGAPVADLVKALEEPEIRTRDRVRRELRGRPADEVMEALRTWVTGLDPETPRYEHHLCEAMWTSWGMQRPEPAWIDACLRARISEARAAAVDVIRFAWRSLPDHARMLSEAAADEHPRVRLAAMVAASWLDNADGAAVASVALEHPVDRWMVRSYEAALGTLRDDLAALEKQPGFDAASHPATRAFLDGRLRLSKKPKRKKEAGPQLSGEDLALYQLGAKVYRRDVHCATCHQPDGNGDMIYPPLAGSEWVTGDETRLVKLVLKGLWGPIEVKGKAYRPDGGLPPMIAFEHMLDDKDTAAVLTYIRNTFGNNAPPVRPETVRKIRAEIADKKDFYTPDDLLQQHPFPKTKGN
ncbi:MAG: c-type cytochrome [Verrucomicrobiae bacterium]|nr:c-type cytochrome [Verrucomicrobiae bacterium]